MVARIHRAAHVHTAFATDGQGGTLEGRTVGDMTTDVPGDMPPKRIDLHCHSAASCEADEAMLALLKCPESFSEPEQVYRQARERGMDFVTLTDHDTIAGALELIHLPNVLVGEELTCYFPEDGCKIHLLVWGVSPSVHGALQARADDIYAVAEYVEQQRLAHAVAHPVYRQNDVLEHWHLERLLLMFKGFECLNGAHSALHRTAFEPMLDALTPAVMREMEQRHELKARWPEPHIKARTGGSDDHGLFNIGRTWTEVPAECRSVGDVLEALRTGQCRPGGEAGSSIKLAHNFYSVGVKYAARKLAAKKRPGIESVVLQSLVGERPAVGKLRLGMMAVRHKLGSTVRKVAARLGGQKQPSGTSMLMQLFMDHLPGHVKANAAVMSALKHGRAPLAEHEAMFDLIGRLNRDVTAGIAKSIEQCLAGGKMMPLFDAVSAVLGQQFLMLPYHFALFHQNRERHHLARITGTLPVPTLNTMKVAVFTDTLDRQYPTGRWLGELAAEAVPAGRQVMVHTCGAPGGELFVWQKDFAPMYRAALPQLPELPLLLPPITEIMEWADRQQFDVVHVETPGPMGLMGVLVARMLNVPLVVADHTDFAAVVKRKTGDHRLTCATAGLIDWLHGQATVLARRPADDVPDEAIWLKWLAAVNGDRAENAPRATRREAVAV